MLKQKKGQLGILVPAILVLIVAAAVLFFGLILTEKLRDTTAIYSTTINNETGFINSSGYTLATAATGAGFNSPAIIQVFNGTGGFIIPSANYTLVGNSLRNATPTVYTNINVTYSYLHGDVSYGAANKTIVGLGTFADFWSLIVLAIVITIVVGVLLIILSNRTVK